MHLNQMKEHFWRKNCTLTHQTQVAQCEKGQVQTP